MHNKFIPGFRAPKLLKALIASADACQQAG